MKIRQFTKFMDAKQLQTAIESNVRSELRDDIGDGDVSALLIGENSQSSAVVITRSAGVFCGRLWVDEIVKQVGGFQVQWHVADGDLLEPMQTLATFSGASRAILTSERAMLNFMQTLSGTATLTRKFCDAVSHTETRILDTRKTLPALRIAQKYAVSVGGGENHRMGLYDAFLIKENHIAAAGSITAAVEAARAQRPELLLEVEVESIEQLEECIAIGVTRVLLDNFTLEKTRQAVKRFSGQIEFEASGGISLSNVGCIAETGVDYISVGSLTKNLESLDLSMRFE